MSATNTFYVAENGNTYGPWPLSEIRDRVKQGLLSTSAQIWIDEEWRAVPLKKPRKVVLWASLILLLAATGGVGAVFLGSKPPSPLPTPELVLESYNIYYHIRNAEQLRVECRAFVMNSSNHNFNGVIRFKATPNSAMLSSDRIRSHHQRIPWDFPVEIPDDASPFTRDVLERTNAAARKLTEKRPLDRDIELMERCEICVDEASYDSLAQATIPARTGQYVSLYLQIPTHVEIHPLDVTLSK